MKSKLIVERRLKEAEVDVDDKETAFDIIYNKILAKIEKKSAATKLKLYKALLSAMVDPLSDAGPNRTKLTAAAREFLKDFEKLSR